MTALGGTTLIDPRLESSSEQPVTPGAASGAVPADPSGGVHSAAPAAGTATLPAAPDTAPAILPPTSPLEWEQVVLTHSARVYRLAYRLTGNRYDAEDLTQEVFVRVFRSLSQYTPGTFEGWLHRITTNLFLDQMRRKQRIRFDALGEDAADRLPGRESSPQDHHDDWSFDGDIEAALDALSPEFRAAVVLCDIEGLSYEEVAEALGIKIGTVRSRIHRGRAALREALAHRAPRGGTATRMPAGMGGRTGS